MQKAKQHEHNSGQYLQHEQRSSNLRQLVSQTSQNPHETIMQIGAMLQTSADRVVGFVALGGLVHFNAFLRKKILVDQVLTLLLHQNFPFVFEEIEASGLGQTVYDISEKKGPYQRTAKKIFDRWRDQNNANARKKKGIRHEKVRFHSDNSLAIAVPFEANQTVDIFSLSVAQQIRHHFRPSIPWSKPTVLKAAAIVQLKINKKCVSETRDEEDRRQARVLEDGGSRMTTPTERYTPGRAGEEMKIVPNDVESTSVVIPGTKDSQKLTKQVSTGENDFVDRLFSTMESAGFPNPKSRKRRFEDPNEGYNRSLPKRRFDDNRGFDDGRKYRRPNQSFRNSRPSHSTKRRVCRYFNTERGCVYGDRCFDIHERPPGSRY